MFVQPELEATLRRAIDRMGNVRVLLEHRLLEVTQHAGAATCATGLDDVVHPAGPAVAEGIEARVHRLVDDAIVTLRARYLIAADGASSMVRRRLAPAIEDLAFDEWWIVVDAWIRGPVQLPPRCVQYCRPSRPGTYIVGPGALRRWEIKLLPHETPQDFDSHEAVWRVLGGFVDTTALEHCRTAIYRFHALVVQQWRHGRVFLMGDAAHQMPPFLGQGLCAGVRDAFNLAWKLDAVMRGQVSQRLLDTYTDERKRHVRTVVGHTKTFGLIIGELDAGAARERDRRLGAELAAGRAETIRQRFIPGLETGLIDRDANGLPTAGAGDLLVQPWVRDGDGPWQRLDDVIGPRFLIAAGSPAVFDAVDDASPREVGCARRSVDGTDHTRRRRREARCAGARGTGGPARRLAGTARRRGTGSTARSLRLWHRALGGGTAAHGAHAQRGASGLTARRALARAEMPVRMTPVNHTHHRDAVLS